MTSKKREEVKTTKQALPGKREDAPIRGAGGGRGGLPKWKAQSEQFRAAMRAANGGPEVGGKGGSNGYGGGAPAYEPHDDRVQCPHCGRKFAELACERHMPHCEQSMKKNAMRLGAKRR